MQPLSTLDTLFLTLDTPQYPLHGAGVIVFDPSTAPEPLTFERVKNHFRRALPLMPPLRRRLVEVPLGLATPAWIEDPNFDLDNHFHHVAVPPPGDDQELATLAGEIGNLPLDFSRPLWDCWFVEGLRDGRVALVMRMHHACIDGMGGLEMVSQLFTLSPGDQAVLPDEDPWQPDAVPSAVAMLGRSAPAIVLRPVRSVRSGFRLARVVARGRLAGRRKASIADGGRQTGRLFAGPPVSFNQLAPGAVHRNLAWVDVPMEDVKTIRKAFGAKLNDVALALCAGSLHRYLGARAELPDRPLTVANPVNLREQSASGQFANRVTIMNALLATHIADPVARLQAVMSSTAGAKASTKRAGANVLEEIFEFVIPGVADQVVGLATTHMGRFYRPPFNTCVTNLTGPPVPLYLCGAKLEHFYIQMMQAPGMGLIIALMSYNGKLQFSVTGNRELLPDVWTVAEGIGEEARLLLKAADESQPGADA